MIARRSVPAAATTLTLAAAGFAEPASNDPNGLAFRDGVLDINWRPFAKVDDAQPRTGALTQLLEKNL